MKKQLFKISVLILVALLSFTSCDKSDPAPIPKGDYDNGYLISNEGNFTQANSSIAFIDNGLVQETDKVFQSENKKPLGDVVQSIAFDGENAFLVVNNSNKIEVVNRYTFKSIATITENLKLPRYAVVENGKLYVTNSTDKSVLVYDATNYEYKTSIAIEKTVEEIVKDNGLLYVMNASYGTGNTITVIDAKTNEIAKTITVGDGLNSIEVENGILYALHKTGITKINTGTNEVIGEVPFEDGLTGANNLEVVDGFIYFVSGSKIFKYSKDVTSLANTELVDTKVEDSIWNLGYGFNVVDGKLFYMDVKGFTENSEVTVYDQTGKLLKTFTAGIGARYVYDND